MVPTCFSGLDLICLAVPRPPPHVTWSGLNSKGIPAACNSPDWYTIIIKGILVVRSYRSLNCEVVLAYVTVKSKFIFPNKHHSVLEGLCSWLLLKNIKQCYLQNLRYLWQLLWQRQIGPRYPACQMLLCSVQRVLETSWVNWNKQLMIQITDEMIIFHFINTLQSASSLWFYYHTTCFLV